MTALLIPLYLTVQASLVQALTPDALARGADAIVDGSVLAVTTVAAPFAAPGGMATETQLAVVRRHKGEVPALLAVVHPGGPGVIVAGMPRFAVGELVRVHLRRRPDGTYRVFGWGQGFTHLAGPSAASEWTTNGIVWGPSQLPVSWELQQAGSDDVPFAEVEAAAQAAFTTWQDVPCATLAYRYDGPTSAVFAIDLRHLVGFIESGWIYGEEAAGATILSVPPVSAETTADIALNGEHFHWAVGPASALAPATLDIQAVLTHEIGHLSGLGHTMSARDTMYYAWNPWPSQRTLSEDDQRGLCSLYPEEAYPCGAATPCPDEQACVAYEHGTLCTAPADPLGAPCNRDRVECDAFCLYGAADYSVGACSQFCADAADCPDGFFCGDASAGTDPVKACFAGTAPIDAAPPDALGPCLGDDQCPPGRFCAAGVCTYECREDIDCPPGLACDPVRGRCLDPSPGSGGCGCRTGGRSTGAGGAGGRSALLLLLLVISSAAPWRRAPEGSSTRS